MYVFIASSTLVPRDPLNSTASPGRVLSLRNSPASDGSSKKKTESGGIPIPSPAGLKLPVIVGEKGAYWCTIRVKGTPGHGSQSVGWSMCISASTPQPSATDCPCASLSVMRTSPSPPAPTRSSALSIR